jgi:hypothetical protein
MTGKFLRNKLLQEYIHNLNLQNLANLHPSLNNKSKIQALIQKQRLLHNPFGQHLAGNIY